MPGHQREQQGDDVPRRDQLEQRRGNEALPVPRAARRTVPGVAITATASARGLLSPLTADQGWQDFLDPASPAAGANYSFTVGSLGVDWLRIVSCTATLATDANAANRLFSLDYINGRSVTPIRNAATVLVTANTSATVFQWDHAHTVSEWNTSTPVFVPLADVMLAPGWSVQLTLDNKQAADAITAIHFVVERYYNPQQQ